MVKLKPFNQAHIEHFSIKIAVPKANQHQHLSLPACSSYRQWLIALQLKVIMMSAKSDTFPFTERQL
jgi:hypothetical protein